MEPEVFKPNLDIIKQIESSGNPKAFNKSSKARGLYQITPIVLQEWNQFNKKEKYKEDDLFDEAINTKIADWYFNRLINHYAPHYGITPTIDNILGMYNWGLGNVVKLNKGKLKGMPAETTNYIKKYGDLLAQQATPLSDTLIPPIQKEAAPRRRKTGVVIANDKEMI